MEAALLVPRKLEQIGLTGYPKTTGGDGMPPACSLQALQPGLPGLGQGAPGTFTECGHVMAEEPDVLSPPLRAVGNPLVGGCFRWPPSMAMNNWAPLLCWPGGECQPGRVTHWDEDSETGLLPSPQSPH